jgi:hypothetical protein
MNSCGTCIHFHQREATVVGHCFRYPPTVFQSGFHARPELKPNTPACGEWKEGGPVIVRKLNAETPGLAAQSKREELKPGASKQPLPPAMHAAQYGNGRRV